MTRATAIKPLRCAALLCGALALGGCQEAREALGFAKQSPDEFRVVTRAPLTLPPDFSLRPPAPGAERPQDTPIPAQARDILLSSGAKAKSGPDGAPKTKGESALLSRADALDTDVSIRAQVNRESAALAKEEESFVDKLIFWKEPGPPGSVVDATKESRRLRENAALGEPVTKGETPVIKRKDVGMFDRLF